MSDIFWTIFFAAILGVVVSGCLAAVIIIAAKTRQTVDAIKKGEL
jgi:hypothetical protein